LIDWGLTLGLPMHFAHPHDVKWEGGRRRPSLLPEIYLKQNGIFWWMFCI